MMFSDLCQKIPRLALLVCCAMQFGCEAPVVPTQRPPTIFDAKAADAGEPQEEAVEETLGGYLPDEQPWIETKSLPWEASYVQYSDGKRLGFSIVEVVATSLSNGNADQKIRQIRVLRNDFVEKIVEEREVVVQVELDSVESNTGELRYFTATTRSGDQEVVLNGQLHRDREMSLQTEEFKLDPRATIDKSREKLNTTRSSTPFPQDGWGTLGVQAVLMHRPMAPTEKRKAKVFVLGVNEFVEVEFVAGQWETTPVAGGKTLELLPIEVTMTMKDETSAARSTNWVNEHGEIQKTVTFSQPSVVTFRVDRATTDRFVSELQFKRTIGKELEFSDATGDLTQIERSEFVVTAEGVDPYTLISQSENQRVTSLGPREAKVTLSRSFEFTARADDSTQAPQPGDLKESPLVPSKHEVVAALAKELCGPLEEPALIAEKLTDEVAARVQTVAMGPKIFNALATARKLEGDVNAKAILLIALLRNRGIPARMASGLRVDPSERRAVFHAWAEAFVDGHWQTLDPNRGAALVLDKIRMHVSTLDEANPFSVVLPTLEHIEAIKGIQAAEPD